MCPPRPKLEARDIAIRGIVQGVGFRPFVYRLAREHRVRGWVLNDESGVRIHAEGELADVDAFAAALPRQAPAAASIASLEVREAALVHAEGFEIRVSSAGAAPTVHVSPDLPVCNDCLREMRDAADPRFGYEYINCTNCGPRYSIVLELPYDRPATTMRDWPMCGRCAAEYHDPTNRRFHAQPTACPECGPRYALCTLPRRSGESSDPRAASVVWPTATTSDAPAVVARGHDAIARAATLLREGAILAIKGIGGYHLACDARHAEAVAALRERKFRKDKPFAVLAASLQQARALAHLTPAHEAELTSAARPIVLAPARVELPGVAPGLDELGLMLPSTPLHELLLEAGAPTPLVLTSANRSSEPICYRDDDAFDRLADLADAFLVGQRAIARRVDDSVVAIRAGAAQVVRRARGLAPAVVATLPDRGPILALGADLKNSIALVVRGEVILSQHIGDLGDTETDRALDQTIADLSAMYAIDSRQLLVVHDLHPQFVSTGRARLLPCAERLAVQHHHAHAASVLAEHGLLDERAVVLALDGTGWAPGHGPAATDGEIWGGEVLLGSVRTGFARVDHLRTAPLPGGDAAARFPVQAAAGRLHGAPDLARLHDAPFHFPVRFGHALAMVDSGVRCFPSSSVGRLFDAAAALLGYTRDVSYEGQAAIWLEQHARTARGDDVWDACALDDRPWLNSIIDERRAGRDIAAIARAFHATLARAFANAAIRHAARAGVATVALTGGVFQNALLDELVSRRLAAEGLRVLRHRRAPCNDGGIALGQAALAAASLAHQPHVS